MEHQINGLLFEDIEAHKDEIYVFQHELESMVPQHVHTQGHILVVLSGVATMNVEHSAYYIPYGYFVWIPSGKIHRISFDEKKIRVLNIYYPSDFVRHEFYQKVGVYPMPSILYHVVELIEGETKGFVQSDWKYELLSTTHHILPHIIKQQHIQLRLPTTDHPAVLRILEAIHKNYQRQLTAQVIGKEIGMSVRSLSRYLRSELDISFVQYLRIYRVLMAIRQMVQGVDSITNIAYSVGYESLTAFSNSFYKVIGCRPSQFLKQS